MNRREFLKIGTALSLTTCTAATGDELHSIKGVGAVSEGRLRELGVTTFAQIAAWSDEDIEAVAPRMNISAERIRHEDWVGQARAKTGG